MGGLTKKTYSTRRSPRRRLLTALIFVSLVVSACGGSASGGPSGDEVRTAVCGYDPSHQICLSDSVETLDTFEQEAFGTEYLEVMARFTSAEAGVDYLCEQIVEMRQGVDGWQVLGITDRECNEVSNGDQGVGDSGEEESTTVPADELSTSDPFCDPYVMFYDEYQAGQISSMEYLVGLQDAWREITFPDELADDVLAVNRATELLIGALEGSDFSSEDVDTRISELYDSPSTSDEMSDADAAYEAIRRYAVSNCDVT